MDKGTGNPWPFPEDKSAMEQLARSLAVGGDDLWAEFQAALENGESLKPDENRMRHYRRMTGQAPPVMPKYTDRKQCHCAWTLRRVGVAVLALLLICTALVTAVGALQTEEVCFFAQSYNQYTSISFIWPTGNLRDAADIRELNEPYDPLKDILPEGYWLQEGIARRENVKYATYINDATGFIAYDISRASGISNIDTENAEQFYETEINGHWAFFVQKNGYHLVWVDQKNATYHHLLANELELEEFMEIAQLLSQNDEHE